MLSFLPGPFISLSIPQSKSLHVYSNISSSLKSTFQSQPIASLRPGSVVLATCLLTLDNKEWIPHTSRHILPNTTQTQFLCIDSPMIGYILYHYLDTLYLVPGFPSSYASMNVRVICHDGAVVRLGKELSSRKITTLPFGTVVRVKNKCVNDMNLGRFLITTSVVKDQEEKLNYPIIMNFNSVSNSIFKCILSSLPPVNGILYFKNDTIYLQRYRNVTGYISQHLNPLSNKQGRIVTQLVIPMLYQVILDQGAIVRSGRELTSKQIGYLPCGCMVKVVEKGYSKYPKEQCVKRLRLKQGGWVSGRLNKWKPWDREVLRMAY